MTEMKPGDLRAFKKGKGKSLTIALGIWAERGTKHLQIHITGRGGHTWITNDPESERYHRTLFRNLRKILIENGQWQFGDEGSETTKKN
jgi:hypothetical protein